MTAYTKYINLKFLSITFIIILVSWILFLLPEFTVSSLAAPFPQSTATLTSSLSSGAQNVPAPGAVLSFAPQADARIRFAYPNSNSGSTLTLNLDADSGAQENFLLKFSVTDLSGYPIERATLLLYNVNNSDKGGDFYFISDNSWDEMTVTWNNAPTAGLTRIYSLGAVANGYWYEVDLTSLIKTEGTYSFRASTTSTNGADYSSKEGANAPSLKITLGGGPTVTPGSPVPTSTSTITMTPTVTRTPSDTATPGPSATPKPDGQYRFAVIGDYGEGNQREADVAAMIKIYNPDFIITTGDNNYPDGQADTIDLNIGRDYHEFIYPYVGTYGPGASSNRFFPALGNHDLHVLNPNDQPGKAYYDYFTLPGNERYYDYVVGPIHFFVVNSDKYSEPDGVSSSSVQGVWLKNQLAASASTWNIVYFHVAPYTSGGNHGSSSTMQWPFHAWGADIVMSGHEHLYERLIVNGILYFVNGIGGAGIYPFGTPLPESQARYNSDWGAMIVDADANQIRFRFITRANSLIDDFTIYYGVPLSTNTPVPSITPTSMATSTQTLGPSITPSSTATITLQPTYTATFTPTTSPSTTTSPTFTATYTPTPTGTVTSTYTPLPTTTPTPTFTSSLTPSPTQTRSPTHTPEPTSTSTPFPDLIFRDSFETGNFMNWGGSVIDSGDLSVSSAAAIVGQQGMAALVDDKRTIYLVDTSPASEIQYRARFYFDPNSFQMSSTALAIFYGYTSSSTQVLRLELRYSNGSYQVRAGLRNDGSTWVYTDWMNIHDTSHFLELNWKAATKIGTNDGSLTFWIDGVLAGEVTNVDNDKRRIDQVALGVLAGLGTATRGTLFFDEFESHRQCYIGSAIP